jgi:AcrR family transcriptional regulator
MSAEVLVKAAELFHTKGFDATTVNEISEATGLTKGGLYHYIEGKRDLLYRIMKFGLDSLETRVGPILEIDEPEEQLRAVIRTHVDGIVRERGLITAVTEEIEALEDKHRREILATKRRYFEFVRGILERLRDQGRLRDGVEPSVAAFNVLGMILHFARWYREDGRLDPMQIADQIADQTLGGVLRPDAPGAAG